MGRWFAAYLDDAGYEMWDVVPHMYKVFIMNAFPPLARHVTQPPRNAHPASPYPHIRCSS